LGIRPTADSASDTPLDPADWRSCDAYVHGLALFDRGYYWEAHERWEALWILAGRVGPLAELLRGLIQLAAAGVKLRQGRSVGAITLAERARGHFAATQNDVLAGLEIERLVEAAAWVIEAAPRWRGDPHAAVEVVFPLALMPSG
jgi:predicted metal-dependent hydrolase